MNVHRLVVRSPQGDLAQGTAWALAPGLVCSAFHVVGHCGDRRWMHELVDGVSYWLENGAASHALSPAAFDAEADLALLACADVAGDALPTAEFSRKNLRFEARGYPGFYDAREFTLSGTVVDLRPGESARGVQLGLDQGADADWAGISGAPVVAQLRVIAAITNVTQGTATAWAAPVEAIRRLVDLANLAARAARAADHAPAGKPGTANLGVDRRRLDELLTRLAHERPDDAAVVALREELARNQPVPAVVALSLAEAARLRDEYEVLAVRQGGRVIRPVASREFAEILGASARFGGRHRELAKLDRHALQTPSGYFFLTGISGFGKTSLLARWIDMLRRRGDNVCFHFFTTRVPDSLEAKYAFLRLNEQLLAVHGLGGDLPRDDAARLRALYVDLLALTAPGGRPLVVVLDGLDEARETLRPSPGMFPHALGDGVHVVFSARHIAGRDWLADLDLQLGDEARIDLGSLGQVDIAEILDRAGLALGADFAAKLAQKTNGDPFYVGDVLRALVKAGGKAEVLDKLPATHSDYLNDWWKEAVKNVAQPGFVDLMGTLAALRAPLGARELASISAEDQLDHARIGVLLEEAGRYVDDDRQGRYWLRHDRIRQFVRDILGDEIRKYDGRVSKFALRWNDTTGTEEARGYGRRHVVAHLLAEDRFDPALEVLSADFVATRWREDGSYSALLGDLDTMLTWAHDHPSDRSAISHALSLAVVRESARDLMRGLNAPLCRAWVRLEGNARPLQMLASLPSHRGEAREQLLAVAGEMLDLSAADEAGRADRATAGELLARTLGMLPLVRTGEWALKALSDVCDLLDAHPLEGGQGDVLLRQAIAYASQIDEQRRDLKAALLARLATTFLTWDRAEASKLIEEIDVLAGGLPGADRAVVLAIAFAAYRELAPGRIVALAEAAASELVRKPSASVFSYKPLELLLSAWAPDARAAEIARGMARAGKFSLALLCKLGLTDIAWQRVEETLPSGEPSVELLLEGYDSFPSQRAPLASVMTRLSLGQKPTVSHARAFALAGRWADVRTALGSLEGGDIGEAVVACLAVALTQEESAEREGSVEFIVGQLERIPLEEAIEPAGKVAHALAMAGHGRARPALDRAFGIALSKLPEGDADDTRQVVAVALASQGKLDQSIDIALGCKWWHRRIAVLTTVLRTFAVDSADRPRVVDRIEETLAQPGDNRFLREAISVACEAALELRAAHKAAALRLVAAAQSAYRARSALMDNLGRLDTWVELHRAQRKLGSEGAADKGPELLIEARTRAYQTTRGAEYQALFSLCAHLIECGSAEKALIEHELALARRQSLKEEDRIAVLAAASAAVASWDPDRAAELLREGMEGLDVLKGTDEIATISPFQRLLEDLTGVGGKPRWLHSMEDLTDVMVCKAGSFAQEVLSGLLVRAWERILEQAEYAGVLQTAAGDYLKRLSTLPFDCEEVLKTVLGRVIADLDQRRTALAVDNLLADAASDLSSRGHGDRAREAAQGLADAERRDEVAGAVESLCHFYGLRNRTRTEQTLFDVDENKFLAAATVQALRNGDNIDSMLAVLLDGIQERRVRWIVFELAPVLAAIVIHRWGAQAGKDVVDAVAEFDRRLIAASSRAVRANVA
jgi:hypothetical protein